MRSTVYHSYFHSLMSYCLIFWGNSSYKTNIFRRQKKIIKIIAGKRNRDSLKDYFKKPKIPFLQSQHSLSILTFVVQNTNQYKSNIEVNKNNATLSTDLHLSFLRLSAYQKGIFYMGIRIFKSSL